MNKFSERTLPRFLHLPKDVSHFGHIINPHSENQSTLLHVRTDYENRFKFMQIYICWKNWASFLIEPRSGSQKFYIIYWLLLLFFSRGAATIGSLVLLLTWGDYFSLLIAITFLSLLFFSLYCYYYSLTAITFLSLLIYLSLLLLLFSPLLLFFSYYSSHTVLFFWWDEVIKLLLKLIFINE